MRTALETVNEPQSVRPLAEMGADCERRVLASETSEPFWFATWTSANHEKRVAEQLQHRGIELFLPLYRSVRRWKDRRVELQLPLFPGYLFVRLPIEQKRQVLEIRGVVCLVGFGGHPAPVAAQEVENIRRALSGDLIAHPHPYLKIGRRVRVVRGALQGLIGILLRKKANWRLILSIDVLKRSVGVEVDACDVVPA